MLNTFKKHSIVSTFTAVLETVAVSWWATLL